MIKSDSLTEYFAELVHKLQGCVLGMSRHVSRRWYVANVIREEISRVWATRS